jgi:hypothetical protein
MKYEGYTTRDRLDDILDKISKYGMSSLTVLEKDFLDSHSIGNENEMHDKISQEEIKTVFEDDMGYFRFEHIETEEYEDDETHYIGILYVPDMEFPDGKRIEGRLEGKITLFKNGDVSPDFYYNIDDNTYYDIFEFCNGLEYELDSFIDYVISEIK